MADLKANRRERRRQRKRSKEMTINAKGSTEIKAYLELAFNAGTEAERVEAAMIVRDQMCRIIDLVAKRKERRDGEEY